MFKTLLAVEKRTSTDSGKSWLYTQLVYGMSGQERVGEEILEAGKMAKGGASDSPNAGGG